jgi:hypothetical protein
LGPGKHLKGLKELEAGKGVGGQLADRVERIGKVRMTEAEEVAEKEMSIAEKVSKIEEGLDSERREKIRLEEERREERQEMERIESIKVMERKVVDSIWRI